MTNDFLAMSLTTDRATPSPRPSVWHMRNITLAALMLRLCKLVFFDGRARVGQILLGPFARAASDLELRHARFRRAGRSLCRSREGRLWSSRPGEWVAFASAIDIGIVVVLAASGVLMARLPVAILAAVLLAAALFAFILDQIKLAVVPIVDPPVSGRG